MIRAGVPLPLGAYERCGGVNLAVFSRHATQVSLLLFDAPLAEAPYRTIDLDPAQHRTGDIWHVWIIGVRPNSEVLLQKWPKLVLIKRWRAFFGKTVFQEAPHLTRHL